MLNSNAHGPMTDEWLKDAKIDNLIGLNMAFSRKVLEKVPSFDPELGPGQLGFADDSLFGMQIHAAGYRLLAVPEARIEHHYDLSRISREHLLKRARSAGRSNAYVDYHWHHKTVARPGYVLAKLKVKLMLMRLGGRGGVRMSEGLSQWESDVLQWKAYLEEMKVLVKKPRNYEKHGLRKLR
jgi:GT2 family glycosyltransferase